MCIIASINRNHQLSRATAAQCFVANSHGAGFAYIEDGRVKIQKGFKDFDSFWAAFEPIQETNHEPKLAHFRVCSAGVIDESNTHPFYIDENHAMVHNGTLHTFKNATAKISDTVIFNHNILRPLFEEFPIFYKSKVGQLLMEEAIGANNKLAILDSDGEIVILNESAGEWVDGIWFSNRSYLPPPPPKKKEEKKYFYTRSDKRKNPKPVGYRAVDDIILIDSSKGDILIEKNALLTIQDINSLTHYYRRQWRSKCKLKNLVYKGIITPIF